MHGNNLLGTPFMCKERCEEKGEWFEVFVTGVEKYNHNGESLEEETTTSIGTFDTLEEAQAYRKECINKRFYEPEKIGVDKWKLYESRDNLPYPYEEYDIDGNIIWRDTNE